MEERHFSGMLVKEFAIQCGKLACRDTVLLSLPCCCTCRTCVFATVICSLRLIMLLLYLHLVESFRLCAML
jgi:hypothetical protein